jgi:5-methylcytosine-specific restriction enzyme A
VPLIYNWTWEHYQKDLIHGVGFHLNQKTKRLHSIGIGDTLWAFSRRPQDKAYVLVAQLIARAKTLNQPGFRYGEYRLWGDLGASQYFLATGQPRIDHVIRSLSLGVTAKYIGQAFQGGAAVRTITQQDHLMLSAIAQQLPPEPRARLIPEERFEAIGLIGDAAQVQTHMLAEPKGAAAQRSAYLYGPRVSRRRAWTGELRERYADRCQLCGWSATVQYSQPTCESHHMQWISRGGADSLDNIVLLCPNHHRVVHRADAVFDYRDLAFVFSENHREPLREPGHLAP